ncbi:MAG: (E)-4-hydroxy-3-methylbut-2-enyl-diphosphate synthase [Myxococcales bacterium]|nr:(E)-4-hydroxy-3-methylbut-2-enyl-diphosphate synthase [Myxococcales bacterium]
MNLPYALDLFAPRRRPTRVVRVGDVEIGGNHPIRLQSMTTTDTLDTVGTADQVERLVGAGCEIVRITAPSLKEAENLGAIRAELARRGVRVPLVADIHFTPNAAMRAAEHVEKIRVNPGNFADKKKFEVREYSDAQYNEEVERVAERFRPLLRRCKELGRALRIGTNHGSLADRILNRYGDTPRGMVESALEFLDVCEDEGYADVVFSMKASNPQVAIQAYRLLAARLAERVGQEGTGLAHASYPFHIGVTEAGDGEDGRVKSAIGIGALLEDGIGDTIRVSLTEDPVKEIPVAAALARRVEAHWARAAHAPDPGAPCVDDPYAHRRRATRSIGAPDTALGGSHPVRVELDLGPRPVEPEPAAARLAASLSAVAELACEGVCVEVMDDGDETRLAAFRAALAAAGVAAPLSVRTEASVARDFAAQAARLVIPVGTLIDDDELVDAARSAAENGIPLEWELRGEIEQVPALLDRALAASVVAGLEALLVSVDTPLAIHGVRAAAARLRARGAADVPIVLRHRREASSQGENALLAAAVDLGAPLCDGIGDAVALAGFEDPGAALGLGYRILQGARQRTSWTEFISCPSCGRTLFDLEETTARIRARTGHLRGVKIAVMGCIVNGPGEMADADFGYVGSGPGTVNLFVGKECVKRHVPAAEACDRLVELIRDHGRWIDPA